MSTGPSFRRVVRATRLVAEGKCPGCEMDYKPRISELESELSKITNVARMLREELNATQAQRDELERRIAYALL